MWKNINKSHGKGADPRDARSRFCSGEYGAMKLLDLIGEYALVTKPRSGTLRLFHLAIRQLTKAVVDDLSADDLRDRIEAAQAEKDAAKDDSAIRYEELAVVSDLNEQSMSLMVGRRRASAVASGTIAGEQRKLYALWRFACKRGYLATWPTSQPVRVPERVPRAWTATELGRLFAASEFASDVDGVPGPTWWRCLFSVLWDTGERITAALQIRWEHVDLEGLSIYIPAESRKGGHVDRLYPIAAETAALLRNLPRHRGPFEWPYCLVTLYRRLSIMLEKSGLPADRRSKFHRIRRSTASHYEAAGGNATELLGHTSRKVTRGYLDPRIVKTTSAVDLLFRPQEPGANGSANDKRSA